MNADSQPPALQGSVERSPRLLVLSYNFPPDQEVGGLRWAGLTKYLARMGWECEVITQPWTGPVEVPEGVEVKRVASLTTFRDLYREIRGIPRDGKVTLPLSASKADVAHGSRERSKLRKLAVTALTFPDVARGWILRAALTLRRRIREFRPDLVVSTGPPHSVHISALLATRGMDVQWWCDLRDPWAPVVTATADFHSIHGWFERFTLTRASGVVTTTAELADTLRMMYANLSVYHLLNAVDAELLPAVCEPRERFSIIHVGSLYRGRDPKVALEGFSRFLRQYSDARSSNAQLELVGTIATDYPILHRDHLRKLGIDGHVQMTGPLPRPEAIELLAGSHVALVLAQEQQEQIPAKIYECLALGIPTLVITEPDSATGQVARELGGVVASPLDPEGVEVFLEQVWRGERRARNRIDAPIDYASRAREFASFFAKELDVVEQDRVGG